MFAGANLKTICHKCGTVRYYRKFETIESIRCLKCDSIVTIRNLDFEFRFLKDDFKKIIKPKNN